MTDRWLDQKRLELLEQLASGARAVASEDGELALDKNGTRQQTQHSARDLMFLEEIGLARHLATGDPYFPVEATEYGRQYVAGSYWTNGWRIGRLRGGRTVIGMPDQFIDVSSRTSGFAGHKDMGRLLLRALQSHCPVAR